MEQFARVAEGLLLACVAVFAVLVAIAMARALTGPPPVFDVTASTERIDFERTDVSTRRWVVHDVTLAVNGGGDRPHSGSIEIPPAVTGFVERVAFGDLWVHIDCAAASAGGTCQPLVRLFDPEDKLVDAVDGTTVDLYFGNIRQRADAGKTILLTLAGSIGSGRQVGVEVAGSSAILRDGIVSVLVPSVFSGAYFEAQRISLGAGDGFRVSGTSTASGTEGFVLADERPALTAAYRVSGRRATVLRPGGGSYDVRVSEYQRIIHDEFFRLVMGLLGFIGAVTSPLSFWRGLRRGASPVPERR